MCDIIIKWHISESPGGCSSNVAVLGGDASETCLKAAAAAAGVSSRVALTGQRLRQEPGAGIVRPAHPLVRRNNRLAASPGDSKSYLNTDIIGF
jgi:hypothetical protein